MGRSRELVFAGIAAVLVVLYLGLGVRVGPAFFPPSSPTPTPSKPVSLVPLPSSGVSLSGTIAFALRGDVYVLSGKGYVPLTSDGRSHQPSISKDGRTIFFARIEEIDGKRIVDGQVVPAHLRFSNVVSASAGGGTTQTVVVNGLQRSADGFHLVTWFDSPTVSPDGKRVAVVADNGSGSSDLVLYDAETGKLPVFLSQDSNLADPAWSPDGKTVAVTSYTVGTPRLLLVPADGRTATPLVIPGGEPYRASYSPDGSWLVYTLRHEGKNDLHAIETSGTRRDIALTTDGKSWSGVFSPDGRQLAFLREKDGVIDLYSMDLADALTGGSPKTPIKLTRGEGVDGASRPAWGS
jgi:Tol biopolymer transport system component